MRRIAFGRLICWLYAYFPMRVNKFACADRVACPFFERTGMSRRCVCVSPFDCMEGWVNRVGVLRVDISLSGGYPLKKCNMKDKDSYLHVALKIKLIYKSTMFFQGILLPPFRINRMYLPEGLYRSEDKFDSGCGIIRMHQPEGGVTVPYGSCTACGV